MNIPSIRLFISALSVSVKSNTCFFGRELLCTHPGDRLAPLLTMAAQQAGNSKPLSLGLLKRQTSGVRLMYKASLIINSFLLLAWSNSVISFHLIEWLVLHACLAIADFSVIPFLHASSCSLILVSNLHIVSPMYTFP